MDMMTSELSRRSMLGLFSLAAALPIAGCAGGARAGASAPGAAAPSAGAWQTHHVASKTDGLDIVYHEAGRGKPLVIVHGGGSNAEPYRRLGDMLTAHFRVVRVERRNYGVSGTRASPITWEQEVGDVGAVIEAVGGRCHLFGHSAGALVSLHVARRRPELVDRLALYEPPLLGGGPGVVAVKAKFDALIAEGKKDEALILIYGHFVGLPEDVVRASIGTRGPDVYGLLPGASADLEALTTLDTDPADWAGIRLETLLLVGEKSAAHPLLDSSAGLAKVLANSRTVTLPGQGHSAQVSAPDLVAAAIDPWFRAS
jgi:pimeloyl-ACP methyl ester carboxylesterase